MNVREWQRIMLELLEGVEQHLCMSAPQSARKRLGEFRERLPKMRTATARKLYEKRLESFLQSAPYLRGAAGRYLTPKAIAALQLATEAMKAAATVLEPGKRPNQALEATAARE